MAAIRPPEEVGDVISTMWTLAPAGARGPVGLAARTADCAVESPVAVRLRALPAAVAPTPRTGTRVPGASGIDVFAQPAFGGLGTAGYAQQAGKHTSTEHDGTTNDTTLGLHSSGRPPTS